MQYDEKCPVCGTINKGLNLEETNGWFECEHCKNMVNTFRVPVALAKLTLNHLPKEKQTNAI